MSFQRALVECTVLSLQDPNVFYPCCKNCFCKMDEEPLDRTRFKCFRCGYRCVGAHLEYRSLEKSGRKLERSLQSKLLMRAVENCFVSRHLVFGIKVTDSQSCPWSTNYKRGTSDGNDMAQFIATQLIFPKVTGPEVSSVLSYYQLLHREAIEHPLESADNSTRVLTALPWIPQNSPAGSFSNITLSRLFAHPLERSQHGDGSVNPTPPWQQSLGLVTSSGQQKEEETLTASDHQKSTAKEEEQSTLFDTPPFSLCSPDRNVIQTPILKHSIPQVSKCHDSKQADDSLVSRPLVWDDMPFSESLTAFFNEGDKYFYTTNQCVPPCTSDKKAPGWISANGTIMSAPNEEIEGYDCSLDLFGVNTTGPREDDVKPTRVQRGIEKVDATKTPDAITHQNSAQWNFIPSCQSTPICRTRPSSSHSLHTTQKRFTSKRRLKKQPFAIQRNVLNGKMTPEPNWSFCNEPLSQSEDNSVTVPLPSAELKVENDFSKDKMMSDGETPFDKSKNGVTTNRSLFKEKECDWSRDLFLDL
ncbi:uncharacterized protein ddias isoform X2 [Stigmatopora nigra]